MEAGDFDAVCALEQQAYQHPWSRAIIGGCTTVNYAIWLGELSGQASHICQAFVSYVADEAHLLNLAVDPGFQGRGFGGRLLDHVLSETQHTPVQQVFLEVRASNVAAIRLYHSRGFNEIGRRPHYYPLGTAREDALVFALQLGFEKL